MTGAKPVTDFDVIIVGSGIAGASLAAELSKHVRVAMIEMESQPGYHATGRSAAVFAPSYGPSPIRALTRASRVFFESPPDGFSETALFSPRQVMMIARNDQLDSLETLIVDVSSETSVTRLSESELREHQPLLREGYAAQAMIVVDGQDIDVSGLHQGYLRQFKSQEGLFFPNARAQALSRQGDCWQVETAKGALRAPIVVNAAGAWAQDVADLASAEQIGLTPKRRTVLVIAEPAGFTARQAPITIDVDEEFYLKPDAGRLLISPADETPTPPCDAQPDEMDVAVCVDRITRAFDLDIRRIENKWSGLRSFVADKSPVIGFSDKADGFFWLAGQGGYGIQTSPAIAQFAAASILGRDVPGHIVNQGFDPSSVAPQRLVASA